MIFWYVITAFIVFTILLNQKINIFVVIQQYIKSLHTFNQKKISWFDIVTFIVFPLILSAIIVYVFDFIIENEIVPSLITTFALIATMLFTFLSITISQYQTNDKNLKTDVAYETTGTIILTILLSIANCIILFISTTNVHLINVRFELVIILYLSLMIFLNMLVILKRITALLVNR